jgi:hypothetical protein
MKIFSLFGFICLAFFAIIILSIGAPGPVPYSMSANAHNGSPFEGFGGMRMHPLEYTMFPDNSAIDSMNEHDITPILNNDRIKVSGYGGILSSPNSVETPLDIYSQATSSTTCQSYGLTNSKGNLCLNPEQLRLLRTRGGNLTENNL